MKKLIVCIFGMLFMSMGYTEQESNGPSPRQGSIAIYDEANKQMIIFGGQEQPGFLSDAWIFDIEKKEWKEAKSGNPAVGTAPVARSGHSAIYDPIAKQIIVFGGNDGKRFLSDTWSFNIEKKEWKEMPVIGKVPAARYEHSAVYDPAGRQMLIFGGNNGKDFLSDAWSFDIEKKQWNEINMKNSSVARICSTAIYDPVNKQMLIFGGIGKDKSKVVSDICAFDMEKKEWKEIKPKDTPAARMYPNAVYDSKNKQMLLFGGMGQGLRFLSDTWTFDIEKQEWKELDTVTAPAARAYSSVIYDSTSNQMIVFGGINLDGYFSDTWIFDIEKKQWKEIETK